jgi:prolyl-tRNA synthetase
LSRRDRAPKEKEFIGIDSLVGSVSAMLEQIQNGLLQKATALRDAHTKRIDSKSDFYDFFTPKNPEKPELHGGFALAHWNGSSRVEEQIKEELKVTIRCLPFPGAIPGADEPGQCILTGEPSARRVIFAKAY